MEIINHNEARKRAEKRVNQLRRFYTHLLVYCIVNAGLFLINYLFSPHHLWFFWTLSGWGIGLPCHALSLPANGLWGEAWKERKIRALVEKQKR
jgi:hypothetical protein